MTDLATDMATHLLLKGAHFMNPIRSYRCTETHKVIQYEKMPWQSKFFSLFCPFKARQSQLRQVSIHRKLLGAWINVWATCWKKLNGRKGINNIFWLEESDSSYILIHHLWKNGWKDLPMPIKIVFWIFLFENISEIVKITMCCSGKYCCMLTGFQCYKTLFRKPDFSENW